MEIIHLMILPQLCLLANLAKHFQLGKTRIWRYSRIYYMSEAKRNLLLSYQTISWKLFQYHFSQCQFYLLLAQSYHQFPGQC